MAAAHLGEHMDGEGAVDAIEHALFNHVLGAVVTLFPRLEHEPDLAGQFRLVLRQQPGGAEQHGHMSIVAAGMHHLFVL